MKKYIYATALTILALSLATVASAATTTVELGQTQSVVWQAPNYHTDGVSVSVIRKVADNPARYELVRTIAPSMSNSGTATWVPTNSDLGTNDFIQVGCLPSATACKAGLSRDQLAVIYSDQFLNTANAFQAIEQLNNK